MTAEFPFKQWLVSSQSPAVEALMKEAAERDDVISFAGGLPADDLFPTTAMRETLERVMAERGREALQYHWAAGLDLDGLRRVLTEDRPNLVYLCPAGHNPTGGTLDQEARTELVELAGVRRLGAALRDA